MTRFSTTTFLFEYGRKPQVDDDLACLDEVRHRRIRVGHLQPRHADAPIGRPQIDGRDLHARTHQ